MNTAEMTKRFHELFPAVITVDDLMRQAVNMNDEIERLRTMANALYEETKRCGSKHDVKATNDWEEYEMAVRGD